MNIGNQRVTAHAALYVLTQAATEKTAENFWLVRGRRLRLRGRRRLPTAETTPPRPGSCRSGRGHAASPGQLRDASVSFHVVDGRMIFAALAGSGW